MNEMNRRPNLIYKMLKVYLLASILSTAVMNLNALIDAILMGQFLGPDALSAITLSNPVELMLNAFALLVSSGAAVIIGNAFGSHDESKIKQSFTIVFLSVIVLAIISVFSAFVLTDTVTNLVCKEAALKNLTHDYIFMQLIIGGLLIANSSLALLIDVAGKPQLAAKAMILQCAVNICCDILYVRVMDGGIMFASLATGTGAVISILFMMSFLLSKECPYRLEFHGYNGLAILREHLVNGVSGMIIQVSMTLLTIICNYFVQLAMGADGMFVQSIGFQSITIGFIVANGVGNGFVTLGSILTGEKDITGLHMLFKGCIRIVAVCTVGFMVVLIFFAPQLATLFGTNDPNQIAMAKAGLPFIVCALPGINMAVIMSMTMLINGFAVMAQIISFSILVTLAISFITINNIFPPRSIWLAYPMSALIIILLILLLTEFKRMGKRSELQFLSLLPILKKNDNLLEMSIPCTDSDLSVVINIANLFLDKIGEEIINKKIITAITADIKNIVKSGECTPKDYIDLRIMKDEDVIRVSIRDAGKAFNPTDQENGISDVYESPENISYEYTFHQNNTVLIWNIKNDLGEKQR